MEKSTLHLIIDKGPKKGETLELNPGSQIRIGRVVRGNTFSIKDPGISQKHISIDFNESTSKWRISDLDTSNGTFLNHVQIQPSVPSDLSDGDTIKIGEMTSISVKIEKESVEAPPKIVGRGRGRPRASKKQEASDLVAEERIDEPKKVGRGRGRRPATRSSVAVSAFEYQDEPERIEVPKNLRRGGGRRRNVKEEASDPVVAAVSDLEEAQDAPEKEKLGLGGDFLEKEGSFNMDNMTLGEWFDRMERYLPEVINDASEEIISSLREKARRFNEFIAKSSNGG